MKNLYIRINIRDGEREHVHHVLHQTNCESLEFAVEWYVAHYWGIGENDRGRTNFIGQRQGNFWWFDNEITAEVSAWKELNDEEYELLNQIMN